MARTFNERYPVRKNRVIKYMNAMKQKRLSGKNNLFTLIKPPRYTASDRELNVKSLNFIGGIR